MNAWRGSREKQIGILGSLRWERNYPLITIHPCFLSTHLCILFFNCCRRVFELLQSGYTVRTTFMASGIPLLFLFLLPLLHAPSGAPLPLLLTLTP